MIIGNVKHFSLSVFSLIDKFLWSIADYLQVEWIVDKVRNKIFENISYKYNISIKYKNKLSHKFLKNVTFL